MIHEHAAAHEGPRDHDVGPGYETRDASVPALLKYGVGLVIALVVIQFAMYGFYRVFFRERPRPVKVSRPENLYEQLRDLRDAEEATLGSYGWVNQPAGVVRIPITRAIDLMAEQGVKFGKGMKSELEMNSHAGAPAPGNDVKNPPDATGSKP